MARTLLAQGADPNARLSNWTPTPRASADWSIHPALVGATPLARGATRQAEALALEAVKVALELGVDPAAKDLEGWTAAERSRYASVRALLEGVAAGR